MNNTKQYITKNQEYWVKKIPYNRFVECSGIGHTEKGLLRIGPDENIKITIQGYAEGSKMEILVEKFDVKNKIYQTITGIVGKEELISILGL